MDKIEILNALQGNLTICHLSSKNVVTLKGDVLIATNSTNHKSYELSSLDLDDCFIRGVN